MANILDLQKELVDIRDILGAHLEAITAVNETVTSHQKFAEAIVEDINIKSQLIRSLTVDRMILTRIVATLGTLLCADKSEIITPALLLELLNNIYEGLPQELREAGASTKDIIGEFWNSPLLLLPKEA